MRSSFVARPRSGPDPAELVPLSERAMYLELVRICFASVVIAWAALAPTIAVSRVVLATSALAYVAVAAVPQMLRRLGKHRVLPLLQLMLLMDGLYLYVESWIRVVGDSGQAHVVTHEGVTLVDEGFV